MIFSTTRFGEIEIEESVILHLPGGLIGFPGCKRVVILDHQPGSPFRWLQSLDDPALAFVVIDPVDLVPDYPLDKLKEILFEERRMERPTHVAAAAITTIPPSPAPITVNLTAPLVFDSDTKRGAQVILHDPRYRTRHLLIQDHKRT